MIDPTTPEEAYELARLAKQGAAELGFERFAPFHLDDFEENCLALIEHEDGFCVTAKHDGKPIGFFGGKISASYWNFEARIAHHIFVYVDPTYRGTGCARKMAQVFERWAKESGADKVTYNVPPGSPLFGKLEDAWVMETVFVRSL